MIEAILSRFGLARIGLALAAVALVGWALHHAYEAIYTAGQAEVQGRWDHETYMRTQVALSAERAARAEEERRQAAQKEAQREQDRLAELARTARVAADARATAERNGLLDALAASAARSGGGAEDPAALGRCQAEADALRAVLRSSSEEYLGLARDADAELDDARSRGAKCAGAYDALIKP